MNTLSASPEQQVWPRFGWEKAWSKKKLGCLSQPFLSNDLGFTKDSWAKLEFSIEEQRLQREKIFKTWLL